MSEESCPLHREQNNLENSAEFKSTKSSASIERNCRDFDIIWLKEL
jgi:hypothetical protein